MLADFPMTVFYTQITVATPPGHVPALAWTDEHVAQGFAWSPGFVAFGIPDHDGDVRLTVSHASAFAVADETLWAVQVPIEVAPGGVEVGTVGFDHPVAVPAGLYNLVFEARAPEDDDLVPPEEGEEVAYAVRLHFVKAEHPSFAILKAGEGVTAEAVLRETADVIP